MEECPRLVADFCGELRGFCSRLETHCSNLRTSIGRAAAPDQTEAAACFADRLNGRVSSLTSRLETLKAVTMGTVSFHELLGHCHEVYKKNEDNHRLLELELERHGYKQNHEVATGETVYSDDPSPAEESYEAKAKQDIKEAYLEVQKDTTARKRDHTDSSYLESLSLKDLGLSASSLAALCADTVHNVDPDSSIQRLATAERPPPRDPLRDSRGCAGDAVQKQLPISTNALGTELLEPVTSEEFNAAPSWLKWQVSMEVLNEFVSKLNHLFFLKTDSVCVKPTDDVKVLKPDDLLSLAYEPQIQKACLLILVKLQKLETGFQDGVTTYAVCSMA